MKTEFVKISDGLGFKSMNFQENILLGRKKKILLYKKLPIKFTKEITDKDFENIVVHTGLECGAIYENIQTLKLFHLVRI